MPMISDEIGTLAAENVLTILRDVGVRQPAGPSAEAWSLLAKAGWAELGADPDHEIGLRELQEVARATGQSTVSTPLVPTLLAGRWHSLDESVLTQGVVFLLERDGEALRQRFPAPCVTVDDLGGVVAPAETGVDDFSALLPLSVVDAPGDVVRGQHLAEAAACFAAVAVGCADIVVDRSVEWASTREQFDRPIKDFQAVRHHLADMHIAREQAWSAAIGAGHEPERAAMWAFETCVLARRAIETGIQVHGGVGYTTEVGLHHHLNQVLQIASVFR